MSTQTVPGTKFGSLRDYLAGVKQASITSPPSAESTIPDDGGKTPETGARFTENGTDVKNMPPKQNVETASGNEVTGNAAPSKLVPNSGLEQTTADDGDSQTRAVKTITGETEKLAALNLTVDADLTTALAGLAKAAAALPALLAASGVAPVQAAAATPALTPAAHEKWAAEQQAVANVVEQYRKMGSDRGRVVVPYLRGFDEQMAHLKRADDSGALEQMMAAQGGGGDPAAAGGAPPMDPAAAMPPMDPAAGGGAPPMDPAAAGGDPAAAMGAPADGGGQVTPDDMAAAFNEAGITPQELVQLLEAMKGQVGGADMPPEAKEKAASLIADWTKVATDTQSHMRSGKYSFKPAQDGSASRRSRDVAKSYLLELQRAGR